MGRQYGEKLSLGEETHHFNSGHDRLLVDITVGGATAGVLGEGLVGSAL